MRSLKRTLILGTTTGTMAVVVATGVAMYLLVRVDLVRRFDQAILEKARLLAGAVKQKPRKIDVEFDELDMWEFERRDHPVYLEMWLNDKDVLFRSPSLGQAELMPFGGSMESPKYRWMDLPDGQTGRAIGIVFAPRVEDEDEDEREEREKRDSPESGSSHSQLVTLVLARDTAMMNRTLLHLATLLVLLGLATIAVLGGVLWVVIRNSLRPLDRLASRISALGEHDLSARVDMPDAPHEIQPVVGRLNDLLGQLDDAFQRERAFSADVAHELRTPLAGLGMKIDVVLSRLRKPGEYQETIGECRQIVSEVQGMVENLLSLARLEAGQVGIQRCPVLLNELVRNSWKPFDELADSRHLQVEWKLQPDISVVCDPAQLQLVIRNVLQNAVIYANEGGSVYIETNAGEQNADLRVRNSGSAISQDQVEQVFERFWRGDTARSETGTHCGLGLSLVKTIVAALDGQVKVQSAVEGDFEIAVSIPSR